MSNETQFYKNFASHSNLQKKFWDNFFITKIHPKVFKRFNSVAQQINSSRWNVSFSPKNLKSHYYLEAVVLPKKQKKTSSNFSNFWTLKCQLIIILF